MQLINIGILSKKEYQNRTIAIAKGEYKPEKNEPKIWSESIKSLAQVLNTENHELLQLIVEQKAKLLFSGS